MNQGANQHSKIIPRYMCPKRSFGNDVTNYANNLGIYKENPGISENIKTFEFIESKIQPINNFPIHDHTKCNEGRNTQRQNANSNLIDICGNVSQAGNLLNCINSARVVTPTNEKTNPQCCEEYIDHILSHLTTLDANKRMNPNYMSKQQDINPKMRAILLDWIIEVHHKFHLERETLFLTVNIIDKYLEKELVRRTHLQLVGITAFLLACKFQEIYPPEMKDFPPLTENTYSLYDMKDMEGKMLVSLEFNLCFTTSLALLNIMNKKIKMVSREYNFCLCLLYLSLIEYKMLKFTKTSIVVSSIYLSKKIISNEINTVNALKHLRGVNEKEIKSCSNELIKCFQNMKKGNLKSIYSIFNEEKHDRVSLIEIK